MNATANLPQAPEPTDTPALRAILARYEKSSILRSLWQLTNTVVPYVALWYLMYLARAVSMWLAIPLTLLAGGLLVRIFIFFHDCGHRSFFKSRRANETLGFLLGILTFTPFHHWRWEHAMHHGSNGNLDRRGIGDIWTLTVQEYLEASRWKRFSYRLARNPIVLFVIAPLFLFLVWQRFPNPKASRRECYSVYGTNVAILAMACGMSAIFGIGDYLLLQLLVMGITGSVGVWLFYVQHQFEGVQWQRDGEWDYTKAALQGSSFYKLPQLLQWFTGNIGFHHIHHLSARIPNYNLNKCHRAEPLMQAVTPLTLRSSLKSFTLRLWDEQRCRLVGYDFLRALRRQQRQSTRC